MKLIIDPEAVYRRLVEADTLRPDDRAALLALLPLMTAGVDSSRELAQAIREYYRDADRSDRTPRAVMYMHIGTLSAHLGAT